MPRNRIAKFFAITLIALIALMPLWHWISASLASPVFYLAGNFCTSVFRWAHDYEQKGATAMLVTNLRAFSDVAGQARVGRLAPIADYRLMGYGTAMFWALMLGSRPARWFPKLVAGSLLLVPIQATAIITQWLNDILNRSGKDVLAQSGLPQWFAEVMAFGHHFNLFIFTALAPIIVWMLINRQLAGELWLGLSTQNSQANNA